jgi:hypothetical protein
MVAGYDKKYERGWGSRVDGGVRDAGLVGARSGETVTPCVRPNCDIGSETSVQRSMGSVPLP